MSDPKPSVCMRSEGYCTCFVCPLVSMSVSSIGIALLQAKTKLVVFLLWIFKKTLLVCDSMWGQGLCTSVLSFVQHIIFVEMCESH